MKQKLSLLIFTFLFCLSVFGQTENQPCPNLEIVEQTAPVRTGEILFFSASVGSEVKNYDYKYKWSVDKGTISEGQGTTVIQVETEGLSNTTITAAFEIEGLPNSCKSKVSKVGIVVGGGCVFPVDDYGRLTLWDELQRIDAFLINLLQDSDSTGFIWISTDKKESVESVKKHIEKLLKHIKFRKFAKERIIFGVEKSDDHRTRFYIIPRGAELPGCENCEIIKGRDLR